MSIFRPYNFNTSTLVKKGAGSLSALFNASGTATITIWDGTEVAVAAVGTITSSGACAPGDYAVGTLTSDATAPSDGETVTVGATGGTQIIYRYKTTPIAINDVAIGASAAIALANLKKAINGTGLGDGTDYFAGTVPSPDIIASTLTTTTILVAFRVIGTGGNAYTTTETSAHLSWGGGTLAGGVTIAAATVTIGTTVYTLVKNLAETFGLTAIPYQVLWVTNEATAIVNLKKAINGSGNAGTNYATGTNKHPKVIGTTITATTLVVQALVWGVSGNAIATTTTLANYAWGGAILASGSGPDATIMANAFVAVAATTYQFNQMAFARGLYVQLSTTGDVSAIYD